MIEYLPRQPSESQCNDRALCASQLCKNQNKLFLSLLGLYNRASLAQKGDDLIMESFMGKMEQSMLSVDCAFSMTAPKDFRGSLSLRDNLDPSFSYINRNWRSGVTDLFMQNAQTSHDSMMRKIEDTCFDLERRCKDVEGPLRAAEEDRDRYACENEALKRRNEELDEQLKSQVKELEVKLWDSSESFKELGYENTRLEQLLQGQIACVEELTASLESARGEFQEQRQNSEQAILAEREKARSKELEMMATLTETEDQLEELQEKVSGLQMKDEETRQIFDQVSSEKLVLSELTVSLKQELASATETLKQTRLLAGENGNVIDRLLAQEEDLRTELDSVKSTVSLSGSTNTS